MARTGSRLPRPTGARVSSPPRRGSGRTLSRLPSLGARRLPPIGGRGFASYRDAKVYRPTKEELDAIRRKLAAEQRWNAPPASPTPWPGYSDPVLKLLDVMVKAPATLRDAARPYWNDLMKTLWPNNPNKTSLIDTVMASKPWVDVGPMKVDSKSVDDKFDELGKLTFDDKAKRDATVGAKFDLAAKIAETERYWDDRITEAKDFRKMLVDAGYKSAAAADRELKAKIASYEKQRKETVDGLRKKLLDAVSADTKATKTAVPALGGTKVDADVLRGVSTKMTAEVADKTAKLMGVARDMQKTFGWSDAKTAGWLKARMADVERNTVARWTKILKDVSP
jgi:hypothetical protein